MIEPDVHLVGAEHMRFGDNVWLDRACTLIAGPPREDARVVSGTIGKGRLDLGNDCHLGVGCIVQAHGGVRIGDYFTASAGAKIYSFSNDPSECRAGTTEHGRNNPGYRIMPVEIRRNVWIGLDVIVLGAYVGDDCFIRAKSIVMHDIPAGYVAGGTPASTLRIRFPTSTG